MRRSIIIGLAAMLMVGVAAGCFDTATPSGSAGTTSGSSIDLSIGVVQIPRWTIRYEVGFPEPSRHQLPPCPAGAACHDIVLKGWTTGSGRRMWARVATHHVGCPAGPGDATLPAACGALATLQAILRTHAAGACSCPASVGLQGEATLRHAGRKIVVPLTFCPYCGHPGADKADAALRVLTPRAA
jgi:hypothetical protein